MTKNYTFRYGDTTVSMPLEENDVLGVLEGQPATPLDNIENALIDSLEAPIQSVPLRELANKASSICLIISDMTRFWMRQDILVPKIIEYLITACGKSYSDIKIVIATGTHVGGSKEDLRKLVTDSVYDKVEVSNHDCRAKDLVYIGTTSYETPVWINKKAYDADLVICLGAATYHVMAGFGGGRKSILPGIAGLETIKHNHAYSLSDDKFVTNPKIGNGVLDGNPLNEDMCEAASLMKNLFMINVVTDSDFRLTGIFSGHWKYSWLEACKEIKRIYTLPIKEKADVVITSCGGFPKDESLYQGTKAVDNVISALKDGGTLVLMLEGRNGGGSPDYFDWIGPLVDGSFEQKLRGNFTVGGYIFFLNCEQASRFNIYMYSAIAPEIVRPMGIKAYSDINQLLKDASLEGKSIYVIPNGSTVLPEVKDE